jgi:excisionase family DNA binding protein
MEQKEIERPMSMTEAAAFTGLKTGYLYKLIHEKKLPCYKPMGGRVFFKQSELETFMFRGRQAADYEREAEAERFLMDRISLFLKGLRVYIGLAYECGLSEEVDALILSEINFKLLGKTAEDYKAVSIF